MDLKTNLFQIPLIDGLEIFVDNLEGSELLTLNLLFRNETLGAIEAVLGSVAEGIYEVFEESIRANVDALSGYMESPDNIYPDDISTLFELNGVNNHHHHMFKFGSNRVALHVNLIKDYRDDEIALFRDLLARTVIFESVTPKGELGEILALTVDPDLEFTRVGNRRYYRSGL
ncbi:MAG: hypothetical protein WCO08_07690 [Actinomycetes bacterium]